MAIKTNQTNQRDQTNEMNQMTVLVAVSDVFFYTKIRDALLPRGYRLERTRSQQEVMEKATALRPAAIILNMNDETLDAFRALEQIKGDDRLRAIPVLAFANHEEVETWKRAKELKWRPGNAPRN